MKKTYTILFLLFLSTFVFAQKPPGMLGKTNLVSYNFTASTRIIANAFSSVSGRKEYNESTDNFTDELNIFRSAHNVHYLHILKRSFGVGLVYNYEVIKPNDGNGFIQGYPDVDFAPGFNGFEIRDAENPEFVAHTIKPSIMWTAKESFLPIGYRNILSVGPRFLNLKDQSYFFNAGTFDNLDFQTYELDEKPDQVDLSAIAIDMSYTGIISYPVTKSIMIELGLTFRTAFGGDIFEKALENQSYLNDYASEAFLSDEEIAKRIIEKEFYGYDYSETLKFENLTNIFSMQFGVAFAF